MFVDARFRGIPDSDFIDQALFSSIERFNSTAKGQVRVSYLSRMVCQSREHTSRRLAKWVKRGYLLRIELAEDQTDYRLTNKAKEAAASYHQERLEIYPDQRPKAVKQEPQAQPQPQQTHDKPAFFDPVTKDHGGRDNKSQNKEIYKTSVRELTAPGRAELIDKTQVSDVGMLFTLEELYEHADQYLEFCESVSGKVTVSGFTRKLERKAKQAATSNVINEQSERLAQRRARKLEALADLEELRADDLAMKAYFALTA